MVTKIRWTAKAYKDLDSIAEYSETEWNLQQKKLFCQIVASQNWIWFQFSEFRRANITSQNYKNQIFITSIHVILQLNKKSDNNIKIYDTRKDPKKFKLNL